MIAIVYSAKTSSNALIPIPISIMLFPKMQTYTGSMGKYIKNLKFWTVASEPKATFACLWTCTIDAFGKTAHGNRNGDQHGTSSVHAVDLFGTNLYL